MAKTELIGAARHLGHQRRTCRLIQRVENGIFGLLGNSRQQGEIELTPDHRRQAQHLVRRVREPIQAAPDHVLHAFGNAEPGDVSLVRPALTFLEDGAGLAEVS